MCAGGKDRKAHLLFLLMSNGLRTVPRLFIFLVIKTSDELGFLALRCFLVRFVFLLPSVGNCSVFWIVVRLVDLCLTYSTCFLPLRLVGKPQLVWARSGWVWEDGTSHWLGPARGRATFSFLSPLGNPIVYELVSHLCKGDVSRWRHFWNSRHVQGVQQMSGVSEKMLGSYHTKG